MSMRAGPEGGADERIPSCVIGVVVENDDPERLGRVRVTYPYLDGEIRSIWVPMAAPMAGPGHGLFSVPEIDTEVVLGFDRGRSNFPFVLGCLWNGRDAPPHPDWRTRMFASVNNHRIMLVDSTPDSGDMGAMVLADGNGNVITLGNGIVTISALGTLRLKGANVIIEVAGETRVVNPSRKSL